MRINPTKRPVRRARYGNPGLREEIHDPYRDRRKSRAPAICPDCGAIYARGIWRWRASGRPVAALVCPACRRIKDRYPAGEVTISGPFAAAHASEALQLINHVAEEENREHPLHRIMGIHRDRDVIRIETTDLHLPRRIGHALEGTWGGELTTHYDEQGYFVRVSWQRVE
jgi:NMD protein affecting ribosome stability and mRNA decay